jgi:hypothetical protein
VVHCYLNDPFETEAQLEAAIAEVSPTLFGSNRIYLDVKKLIGGKGKTKTPSGARRNECEVPENLPRNRNLAN